MNTLPWELDVEVTLFLSALKNSEANLRARTLGRKLSTLDSNGKPHDAFEFLSKHKADIKALKLKLVNPVTGVQMEASCIYHCNQ